jgi:TonB-linked SusC/RagA family outer membrane protein
MKRFLLFCFAAVFTLASTELLAQERTVSGRITSAEDGGPLPGVNVVLKGTTTGTATDADGRYSLAVPSTGGTLVFSFIGLTSQEVEIGTRTSVDVQMAQDVAQLNEVVVTAGGLVVQRRELGNQATTVTATDITQGKSPSAVAGLQGKVPGLLISAVSSGVNPNYRVVLRGNRSLLGNNQALLVLDNIITPNEVLGNLNPEDILDIQVLNGAGAAALYGSDASNGALIVTTKRGLAGKTEIRVSQTTTLERVSYLPQLQTEFGSGTTPDTPPVYTPFENQQYGPRFDGTIREIGKPLEDGSIQSVPYSATDARQDFWETGMMNQTDFSVSSADEKGGIYAAGQLFKQHSTVPWDHYNRYSVRVNMDRKIGEKFRTSISTNYIANNYDVSWQVGNAFLHVLMSPAQVDITRYQRWRTDPFANPNGYFNEYYDNPYFTLENNRQETRNNYLQGTVELKYNPIEALTFTGRVGLSTRNVFSKYTSGKFTYTEYTKGISGSSKVDDPGFVGDLGQVTNQLIGDLLGEYKTSLTEDLDLTVVAGFQSRTNNNRFINISGSGLVVSGVYNVSNVSTNIGPLGAAGFGNIQSLFESSQFGVYGDVRLGFKDWAYLHFTGRNDWRSVLSKENRSFFYPAVDVSLILSDAISSLQNSSLVDALKIRGGYSQVGQVNIPPYALNLTFNQVYGYPYSSGGGFSISNTLASPDLKPEITTSIEAGFDLDLKKYAASVGATVYQSSTVDQTIPVQLPSSSGYNELITNVGEVQNKGLETYLRATPIETSYGLSVTGQVTYTVNKNEVISLSDGSDLMILPGGVGNARIVAKVGESFPLLQVTEYTRTEDGRIIVDPVTGFPSTDGTYHDVGTTAPTQIMGLTGEVKYKNWRLAATAEYRTGHYIYNSVTTAFDFSGAGIRNTWFNRERFVVPNSAYEDPENPGTYITNTNVTTATGGADFWTDGTRNTGIGENYMNSAAFWKIREISLRFNFPASILAPTKFIKGATVGVQGRNLFIWTPDTNLYTDPEYSANGADSNAIGFTNVNLTPPARYIGGSISLTF